MQLWMVGTLCRAGLRMFILKSVSQGLQKYIAKVLWEKEIKNAEVSFVMSLVL